MTRALRDWVPAAGSFRRLLAAAWAPAVSLLLAHCGEPRTPPRAPTRDDTLRIVGAVLRHRAEADTFFRFDPDSPFRRDTSSRYTGIRWFPPDAGYSVTSKLSRFPRPDTVVILGTKGEERRHLRYGFFRFELLGREITLNVYKSASPGRPAGDLLAVWFTDETTGRETYEVGRYVDVGRESPDPDALYDIEFNNAYNPYCAYTPLYSCAIPPREDHLPVAIRAGELKYHP